MSLLQPSGNVGIPMTVPRRAALLFAASLTAVGCRPHTVRRNPPPPIAVPPAFAGQGGAEAGPDRWWQAFADPGLDQLVERTLADNFQLTASWARLDQIRAVMRQTRSFDLPEVTASASAGRQKLRFELSEGMVLTPEINVFQAQVGAAYEVDVWRRIDSNQKATALDAVALRDATEAIAVTLVAQVTEAWLDVRFQRARRTLLGAQLDTNQKSLEVLEARFREGLGSSLDVYQQRSLVAGTRAQIVQTESAIVTIEGRLAVLLGTTIDQVRPLVDAAPDTLPAPPPVPATGVPASLLDRRPDVRAARRRVEAADYRVAAAVADRLPSLRLSGALTLQSSKIADLVATPLYSILASVTAPLFDYGRRKAEVDRNRAIVEERLAEYGDAMVTAMVEVETALAQERHFTANLTELLEQETLAAETVRAARDAYREGQIDYLPVLSAVQGQQQVEQAILAARRQLLSLRVTLYRALGGTWPRDLEAK